MKFIHATAIAGLACAGLLASDVVYAQARAPSRSAPKQTDTAKTADMSVARDEKLAELDAWLSRLVGKFRVEAHLDITVFQCLPTCESLRVPLHCAGRECRAIRNSSGAGDCDRVGDGPGVHCLISVPWLQPFVFQPPPPFHHAKTTTITWPGRILEPATILFGIDPDALAVRYLLVDGKSIAEEASGSLQGDTVTFTTECVNESVSCRQKLSILAPEDGGKIRMTLDISFRSQLGYERKAGFSFTLHRL